VPAQNQVANNVPVVKKVFSRRPATMKSVESLTRLELHTPTPIMPAM